MSSAQATGQMISMKGKVPTSQRQLLQVLTTSMRAHDRRSELHITDVPELDPKTGEQVYVVHAFTYSEPVAKTVMTILPQLERL